jgi:hypothetical protein
MRASTQGPARKGYSMPSSVINSSRSSLMNQVGQFVDDNKLNVAATNQEKYSAI